jgi:hypothetical protein
MVNMMLARGMIPDEVLLDGWTQEVDETLTPTENLEIQLREAAEQRGEGARMLALLGPTLKEQERNRRRAEAAVKRLAKEKGITLPDDFREFIEPERTALANLETIIGGGQEGTMGEEGEFIPAYMLKGEEEEQGVGVYAPRLSRAKFKEQLGGVGLLVPLVTQNSPSSCGLASALMAFAYRSWPAAKYFIELGDQSTVGKEDVRVAVQLGMCHALLLVRHRPKLVAKLRAANLYTGFVRSQNAVLGKFSTNRKLASAVAVYRREHVVLPALVRAYLSNAYKSNHELHVIAWICGFNLEHHPLGSEDRVRQVTRLLQQRKAMLVGFGQEHWAAPVAAAGGTFAMNDPAGRVWKVDETDVDEFITRRNAIFYVYGRIPVEQLKTRPAMLRRPPGD